MVAGGDDAHSPPHRRRRGLAGFSYVVIILLIVWLLVAWGFTADRECALIVAWPQIRQCGRFGNGGFDGSIDEWADILSVGRF